MMAAAIAAPAGLARLRRSRTSSFKWRNRTATGDTDAFRVHYRIWDTNSLAAQSLTNCGLNPESRYEEGQQHRSGAADRAVKRLKELGDLERVTLRFSEAGTD